MLVERPDWIQSGSRVAPIVLRPMAHSRSTITAHLRSNISAVGVPRTIDQKLVIFRQSPLPFKGGRHDPLTILSCSHAYPAGWNFFSRTPFQ
jgi:hypothetical protein